MTQTRQVLDKFEQIWTILDQFGQDSFRNIPENLKKGPVKTQKSLIGGLRHWGGGEGHKLGQACEKSNFINALKTFDYKKITHMKSSDVIFILHSQNMYFL